MNIKQQVVSLELAKKMKELGWIKETQFCWAKIGYLKDEEDEYRLCFKELNGLYDILKAELYEYDDLIDYCNAPIFAEIWEELPHEYEYKHIVHELILLKNYLNETSMIYQPECRTIHKYPRESNKSLAEAVGKMWCWLKENGY